MITKEDGRTLLESLGFRPVINAYGAPSRLGGTILSAEVRAAMDAAAQHCIPLAEMQARASALIAEISGAEAGCVAPGAAASLFLGTAACLTGSDLAAIDRLPDTSGMRNEVVIHRAHRNPYDHAVRATGARLVEIGYLGLVSGVGTHPWQLRAAMTPQTAAVYFFPPVADLVINLATVVQIAKAHGVPVIVDGSAVADIAQLRGYFELGVDLVAVSGGKSIAGPAASGFLAGRRDLIRAATLQQQDMFVHPDLWSAPLALGIDDGQELPHQGVGRTMKVGREEIAGLLVALTRWAQRDSHADEQRWSEICDRIARSLQDLVGVTAVTARPEHGAPYVVVKLQSTHEARRAALQLECGQPRIFIGSMGIGRGELLISPYSIADDDVQPLIGRMCEVLGEADDGM